MSISRVLTSIGHLIHMPVTLARRGVLNPGRPDRMIGQLTALARWGMTPAGGFESSGKRDPHNLAIIDDAGELTYGELSERTTRWAHALASFGLECSRKPQERYPRATVPRVGLLCRNGRSFVETVVACSKLGADIVLLNTGSSAAQVKATVADQGVQLVVADADFASALDALGDLPPIVVADGDVEGLESKEKLINSASNQPLKPPKDRGRTVVLTSGTTGTPKGAKRPHPHLRSLTAMLSRIPLRAADRVHISAPLFHTWGYAGMQLSMAVRATLVLPSRFEPEEALRSLSTNECQAMFAVPIMLQRMVDLPEPVRKEWPVANLRAVAISGSRLPGTLATSFMDTFGDVIYNLYGGTEFSWASIASPKHLRTHPDCAGKPPFGTKIRLLNESGEQVPPGHSGRIYVGNDMLSDGYTNGKNREIKDGLMDAGDFGFLNDDGLLIVEGRSDDVIISGGENVMPREVEDELSSLDQVSEVAVIGVEDTEFGQRLAAYLALRPGSELTEERVRQHVRENLAKHCVPRDVYFLDSLPRNAAGKVVPRQLKPNT